MNKHAMPCIPNWMCVVYIYTNAACKIRLAHRIVCCCCRCCSIAIQRNRYTSMDINSAELIESFYGIAVDSLMLNHLTLFVDACGDAFEYEFSFTSGCFLVRVCFDSEFSIEMSNAACLHAYEVCFSLIQPIHPYTNTNTHQVCVRVCAHIRKNNIKMIKYILLLCSMFIIHFLCGWCTMIIIILMN